MTIRDKFREIAKHLNSQLVERDAVIYACLVALLARKHVFLLGPPGTAKSLVIELFCRAIKGASYFRVLINRYTQPEELFGPMKMSALKEDRVEYSTGGFAPTAIVVFFDEIWKAGGSILNTLLTFINERLFFNGNRRDECPLVSAFCASNELPEDSSLNALYDRLMLRLYVDDIVDDDNFKAMMLTEEITDSPIQVTLDELSIAQTDVKSVALNGIVDILTTLRGRLKDAGFEFSPRRWRESVGLLQARAYLEGRSRVDTEDIEILRHVFWNAPEDRANVERILSALGSPEVKETLEWLDKAKEVFDTAIGSAETPEASAVGFEANEKFKKVIVEMTTLYNTADADSSKRSGKVRIEKAISEVKTWQRDVLHRCVGYDI